MKTIKIILAILLFSIAVPSNAQFFKKLKQKTEQKIKHEAERRAQRRVDRKIDKTFDKAENEIDGVTAKKNKKSNKKSKSNVNTPATNSSQTTTNTTKRKHQATQNKPSNRVAENQTVFKFSHIYSFTIQTEKKKGMQIHYYLQKDADYLAAAFPDMKNKTISIFDFSKGRMIMLMHNGDSKTRMNVKMDFKGVSDDVEDENISITKTGKKKKILGYNCEEYFVKGDDFTSNVWVTTNADISFPKNFTGLGNKKMKNQNNTWMFKMKGMALEMTVVDTSKKKPRITKIVCTKLAKEPRTIDISPYKKIM